MPKHNILRLTKCVRMRINMSLSQPIHIYLYIYVIQVMLITVQKPPVSSHTAFTSYSIQPELIQLSAIQSIVPGDPPGCARVGVCGGSRHPPLWPWVGSCSNCCYSHPVLHVLSELYISQRAKGTGHRARQLWVVYIMRVGPLAQASCERVLPNETSKSCRQFLWN